MPTLTMQDKILLHIGTCRSTALQAIDQGNARYPMPLPDLIRQAASDRLSLASWHLHCGDGLLLTGTFRASIGRHYYAMYHGARAIVYATHQGDDFEKHAVLPRNLPTSLPDRGVRELELTDARLLRNQADYDPYPVSEHDWEAEARQLATTAAAFVQGCEDFALTNGLL